MNQLRPIQHFPGKSVAFYAHTLLIILMVLCSTAIAGPLEKTRQLLWESPDHNTVIYSVQGYNGNKVCPKLMDVGAQPFCRLFPSSIVEVCGDNNGVILVLANGDIHHLNRFLIGRQGNLQPAHHPTAPTDFVEAWIPSDACNHIEKLPRVFAVDKGQVAWHFDGTHWSALPNSQTASAAYNQVDSD
jgi:hypothetical protein